MIFISLPKKSIVDAPAVVTDRLRSWWITPGMYLILEGVVLGHPDSKSKDTDPSSSEGVQAEHFLVAVDGDLDQFGELCSILADHKLPEPTIWEESYVMHTVDQAAQFYLQEKSQEIGSAIYQRLSEALPDSYMVLSNAGCYFLKAGSVDEARSYIERAYDLAPKVPEVAINLMALRLMEGNGKEAERVVAELVAHSPHHPLVQKLISICHLDGRGL